MAKTTATVQIKQIAEKVGMSQSTVSIVLNGRGDEMRISKESQQRIQAAAKEMNYQPNIYARRLRRAASEEQPGQIICVFWNEAFVDNTMSQYFKGIFRAIEENHYGIEIMVKLFRAGKLYGLKDQMNRRKYNGILLVGASSEDLDFLNREQFDIPIVINRPSDKYSSVYVDGYETGAECARMFGRKGFSTAGLLSADTGSVGPGLRELGFLNECRKLGIEVRDSWILRGASVDMETGYECARQLSGLKELPQGLFILQDVLAIGAMMQLRGSGLRVPGDLSVITYGLNPMLRNISPSVTMIGTSMADTGESATNILMTVLSNNIKMPISKLVPVKYEYGDSFRLDE